MLEEGKKGGGAREYPGLFVFNTCDHFIRTMPTLPRDDRDLDDVDTDSEDHVADEVRYRVLSGGARSFQGTLIGLH